MASTSAEVKRLSPGENILLYGDNFIVGVGSVHSVDESELYHGEIIGRGRISVQICSSLRPDFILPYPSPGANTVGEAVNSFAIWDISKLYPMPQLPQSQYQEAPEPTPNDSTQVHADERQSTSRERESNVRLEDQLFFKVRKNWANVEVTLLSIVESLPIVDGIIFLPFSTSCVGEVRVGEQYAQVLVSTVHSEVDPTILDRDLPNFHPDDPITVRWPILHLRIASNGAILGHLYKAFEDAGTKGAQTGDEDMPVKKKRAYKSAKRTKPNPELLLQRRLNQKKMSMCTPDKISECLRFTCTCSRECMRKVDKKDIIDERSFFYNEPYTRRVEYILSKFDHPGFEEDYMLFRTLEVCKKTFYTLYGFVKQTFYNYEKAYTMGQRVGFHGNSGTFKPKDTTIFARACMKSFFQQTAEPLPHKESRNENTDGIIYRLPKALSRDDVYREILGKMEAVGMTAISRVAFDNLWKKEFPNYGMHNSSAFAKCLLCVKFTTMLQRERRSAEKAKLELDREKHLKHQMSGRTVYYSHIELSTSSPSLYLSFIHDAMDLAKTIIPRVVAHVTVGGLWKLDPNYTITSIAKQLRDYENFHTDKKLGDLHFTDQTSHPLFNALMDEEVFNTTVLAKKRQSKEEFFQMEGAENSELQASTRMLPPNLYIQLDNSAKDNKNWAMMAFCSELVARGCCKMITMSFLVIGHTHEDVDAFFSKMNAAQARKDIESLPHFLAVVYHAQSSKAYPRVIQEVADYKEHVKDYMDDYRPICTSGNQILHAGQHTGIPSSRKLRRGMGATLWEDCLETV
ncbi:hypothetical protein R1sor_010353 [Riccia sorocarpa]|uniref:DUF7869 domain-containing protein n=1 Tax=Riccia sorocarpa TaxID=122646 RepID=A0ABD3I0I5_9MARC